MEYQRVSKENWTIFGHFQQAIRQFFCWKMSLNVIWLKYLGKYRVSKNIETLFGHFLPFSAIIRLQNLIFQYDLKWLLRVQNWLWKLKFLDWGTPKNWKFFIFTAFFKTFVTFCLFLGTYWVVPKQTQFFLFWGSTEATVQKN